MKKIKMNLIVIAGIMIASLSFGQTINVSTGVVGTTGSTLLPLNSPDDNWTVVTPSNAIVTPRTFAVNQTPPCGRWIGPSPIGPVGGAIGTYIYSMTFGNANNCELQSAVLNIDALRAMGTITQIDINGGAIPIATGTHTITSILPGSNQLNITVVVAPGENQTRSGALLFCGNIVLTPFEPVDYVEFPQMSFFCEWDQVEFNLNINGNIRSYHWEIWDQTQTSQICTSGIILGSPNSFVIPCSLAINTIYVIRLDMTDFCGNTISTSGTFNRNNPQLVSGPDQTVCSTDPVDINYSAHPDAILTMTPPHTNGNTLSVGTHTFTINADLYGCIQSDQVVITVENCVEEDSCCWDGAHNGTSISELDPKKVSLGNALGATLGELINPREIPMNSQQIYFTNNGSSNIKTGSRIGIGMPAPSTLQGKLHINVDNTDNVSSALFVTNKINGGSVGERIDLTGNAGSAATDRNVGSSISVSGISGSNIGAWYDVKDGSSHSQGLMLEVNGSATNYGVNTKVGEFSTPKINYGSYLDVKNATDGNYGIYLSAQSGAVRNYGIYSEARNGQDNKGVDVYATNGQIFNYGIQSYAHNPGDNAENVGIYANATVGSSSATKSNYGIKTYAYTPANKDNYGVYGYAQANYNDNNSFGIYGKVHDPNKSNSWAGYFDGNIQINGYGIYSGNVYTYSDRRFKTDIKKLEKFTEKIMKLNGYSYNMKTEEFKDMNFRKEQQIGLIAQEVKEVFPQLVKEDSKGFLSVNYDGMIPVLLEVAKEQQSTIENQQKQIDELKKIVESIANLNNNSNNHNNSQDVNLSDKNTIVLDQNVPNPFAEKTVINYFVPEDTKLPAQIIFTNSSGVVIKTVEVKETGAGTLNVFANDLSSGIYSYSIVVDGKTISTKKMVRTK